AGTDSLGLAATGSVDVTVTVTPGGDLGPYDNTAFAQGFSPAGSLTLDNSVDGLDSDPDGNNDPTDNTSPTPVSFVEDPVIGTAKSVSAGPVNNGDGTYTLTYSIFVENTGDVPLTSVQVVDDLAATYALATGFVGGPVSSGDFVVNAGYDGSSDTNLLAGTDTLLVGGSGTIEIPVTVTPGAFLGPYDNSATASGTSSGGMVVSDISQAGTNPDPDGDNDPGNNNVPTPVSFVEMPQIGVAKAVNIPTNNGDGTFTLTYSIFVENTGNVPLSVTQVTDDLATTFAGAAGFMVDLVSSSDFAVNPGYDGDGDTNLLAGTDVIAAAAAGTIDLTVTVTPGANPGPYDNTAVASAETPAGTPVSDISTIGTDPDPDNDGPADDMTPTPVSFGLDAALEGNAWLDNDIDDLFDSGEPPLEGWIIEVLDSSGTVVASVPVNPDGSYSVGPLPPGMGYSVQLRHPSSSAVFGKIEDITLPPGLTVIDQNLPIDPSGVFYDSTTRMPVAGVIATLVDGSGTPLPAACLLPGQQDQVTGADGLYRFDVLLGSDPACASGSTFDIVFTVPAGYVAGESTVIPATPGPLIVTGLPDPFQVQPQATAPAGGASTLYYLSVLLSSGDPNVINNHIPIDPIAPAANLMISKRADRRQTVVGDLVAYTVTVENPGAAITGLTLSDLIPAGFSFVPGSARLQPATGVSASGQRPVLFSGIDVAAGGSTQLSYMLRVGAGVVQGDYTNTVTPLIGGVPVGNSATATVTVITDPDFEQTSVVGMVFNDANGDGWQDDGEYGIPGVRLATVEGLIIETDAFGRYHIAGLDGGRHDRGRNFIIKVDTGSLPDGVEFTTENPRVQRITEGLLNRFDFGVRMPAGAAGCCEQIDVKIGEIFFNEGSADVRPEFLPLVQQLADRLRESAGGRLYIEGHAEPSEAVAYTADAYTVTQHFAPRSTELRPEDKAELDAIIAKWRGANNVSVTTVGHTCNTPIALKNRKEFKDNYALSRARAQKVASYVRLGLGIAPEQVSIDGKGPDQPVASNDTPEGGARNRRVELTISGQRSERQITGPADLARDRANAVYKLLQRHLGDELIRKISIETGAPADSVMQESEMTSDMSPGWLSRGAGALLGLLVTTAQADTMPESCTIESCRTDDGYVIQIMPSSEAPSPNDTRAALADNKRVDVSGQFSVPVSGGGMLWATEDPSTVQPRLAVHAHEIVPLRGNALAMPVSFFVYSNYPVFIEKAELQIYHGDDIDLIEPLATVPFKPGVFNRVDWQGTGLSRAVGVGDELYFRVRAYDAQGRYDETHLDHLRLVTEDEYERSAESDPDLLMPYDVGMQSTSTSALGPLDGNVLVLQPPAGELKMTRGSYTLTPHFDSRKTILKQQDRSELDTIVAGWANAKEVRLHIVGHTDNVRIAPQNRHEFANNQVLSEARARAIAEYVAAKLGLQSSQITSEGRAEKEPVATNDTAAGRALNRRVELTLTGRRADSQVQSAVATTLVEPHSNTIVNIDKTLEEALNLLGARLGESSVSMTGRRYANADVAQSSAHALQAVYGRSDLRLQRIPVNGSRVRINGQDIGSSMGLRINGEPVPLDSTGKYAVEYLMPVGKHNFDVELIDERGSVTTRKRLPVEVSGKHIFMVALADLTVSDNNVSGSIEPLAADDRYDDDLLVEGRLAFYLKGKIKGKYLITAQLDSTEEEIGDLFSNLFDKDPQSVLRRLDPDRYYPVYGDDSTTISDTDTQGRFYFRADWDRSRATWGNFHTGFTGNEFAQYNRSLYGAQYQHESLNVTSKGQAKTEAIAFVSEAQSAFGHSEFSGTGGSLYYLKHQDILPGSEKAWIEVRDRDSNRVRELITLQRGVDYEVDEIQGRIILSRPLMQVTRLHAPGLIKDTPLDGDEPVLLVDYEYLPNSFRPDKVAMGGRASHWITDDIAIGATIVNENRDSEDYGLLGGDIVWQPGEGTYVKAEFAQSEASQANRFQSSDGGLTFDSITPVSAGREGDAWGIEARVNSREAMNTDNEWVGGGWYRRTDDNYSVARRDPGVDTTEYGVELTGKLSPRLDFSARGSVVERESVDEDRRISLQADYALADRSKLSGELRGVEETRLGSTADGTLLALRYSHILSDAVEVYGIGQFTIENDSGSYDNNDLATVGASINVNGSTTLHGEYSTGHRGNGALLNLDYRLDDRHEVYGTFTQSVDRTDLREPGTKMALGHRSRITDQATLFNERQFVEDRGQAGIAHVFGLDFDLGSGWAFGVSAQNGELETETGAIDRDAGTVTANYRSNRINWRGKAEYRNETGVSDVRQVLTTNRLDLKLNEDWRLLTRINHSETEDRTLSDRDDNAVFSEAGLGFAYRPVANSRLNLLAKYTFLYDLPAPDQIGGGTDQRSHVVSLEGIYRLNPRWELGGKLAQRSGELRVDRDFGRWFESTTNFLALRGRYHLIRRWDAMLEYRTLDVDEAGSTRDGWLVSLDRHMNDHFRLGVGYNFTDFSDDLTNLDYDHDGWFINAIGKY
ncbi:MAG: OmpA family protein, partial [Gammaproteobacteria bacterium]|nr:OmpA family protein [Gammaproteobacteria bacterium]